MNYQKEYANLVGQIDRALSILELYQPGDPIVRKAGDLLLAALRDAEEHYLQDTLQEAAANLIRNPAAVASRPKRPLPTAPRRYIIGAVKL